MFNFRKISQSALRLRNFSTQTKKIEKLLVANRGEIACRVFKTCKKMGIKTVAVYSEPDARGLHTKMADEAICVGPAASAESYLNMENILAACKETGAQAVHPGYGFLSENNHFQKLLQDNGIAFVGPREYAIEAMGDKITSKKVANEANVNTIPGVLGEISEEEVVQVSRDVGYPVMIKASAGGGGKGMRVAWNDEEAREGFRLSKSEAKASFGDDTIFVEKYIEEPRHIEIQILMDSFGNGVYLNERECSIQRRNQKVIEEAPSVFLDAKTRQAMGEQALALARAVQYQSAGTVEFLVDKHRNFYFLEMNTRLQVEHPVTEYITGVDLVENMIKIAQGEKLALTQADIGINGWSFESRVYAEDPLSDFLPSIGTLSRYVEPLPNDPDVRCDSGIVEGSEISMYYDPLISKLVSYGKDRDAALQKMREALDNYVIKGVTHNINFLRSICDHPRFVEGAITTNFIPEEYPEGYKGAAMNEEEINALIASVTTVHIEKLFVQTSITGGHYKRFDRVKAIQDQVSELVVTFRDRQYAVKVDIEGEAMEVTNPEGETAEVRLDSDYEQGLEVFSSEVNGVERTLQLLESSDSSPFYTLQYMGTKCNMEVRSKREQELHAFMLEPEVLDTAKMVLSPMPGQVISVSIEPGQTVAPNAEVCVLEAMKMQNVLRATAGGVVKSLNVKVGDNVKSDAVLVEFE